MSILCKKLQKTMKAYGTDSLEQPDYKYCCMAAVQPGQSIFDVKFHLNMKSGEPTIFAVAGSKRVTIFECKPEGGMKVLQVYSDPEDSFFCCAWSNDTKGHPVLAAAGEKGFIRLISPGTGQCFNTLRGHPNSINDMAFHPRYSELLLTASKDRSMRIWNCKTAVLVVNFGGVEGHRDEVISIDFDIAGNRIVSGGMDHAIKIWNLNKPNIQAAFEQSKKFVNGRQSRDFPTVQQNFPDFTTREIHGDYVDCVRWFGDLMVSKSVQNQIHLWKAGWPLQKLDDLSPSETHASVFGTLGIEDCTIWYVRFSMDRMKRILALGNQFGNIFLYDLTNQEPSKIQCSILTTKKCVNLIRQTAFSRDGSILIAVCDDGTIWRWNAVRRNHNNNTIV